MLPDYLTDADLDALIRRALREDVGDGDVTTQATVPPEARARGRFVAKEDGVLAGLSVARRVFEAVDPAVAVDWHHDDGALARAGTDVGTVEGPAHAVLTAERLALNLLQRMSGIATATRRMVEAVHPHPTRILDTRKTAPGLRGLDKWAVHLGGGTNHRIGLFDLILVKDNHIAAAGGLTQAVRAAATWRDRHAPGMQIEVEVRTLDELDALLQTDLADIVLLDNMARRRPDGTLDVTRLHEAVRRVDGRLVTEASGNVTLETAAAIAATGVDALSSGALTHSVTALDVSLQLDVTG